MKRWWIILFCLILVSCQQQLDVPESIVKHGYVLDYDSMDALYEAFYGKVTIQDLQGATSLEFIYETYSQGELDEIVDHNEIAISDVEDVTIYYKVDEESMNLFIGDETIVFDLPKYDESYVSTIPRVISWEEGVTLLGYCEYTDFWSNTGLKYIIKDGANCMVVKCVKHE